MDWSKESVVVTGGAGFIGSHLVDALSERHARITVIDDTSRGRWANLGRSVMQAQIGTYHFDLARGYPPLQSGAIVFHLAAKVTGIHYNAAHQLEMMQSNLAINLHVTEMMRRCKPKLYVFVSTACVYPHDAPVPTPEECANVCDPEPTNFGYGVAKWVGEQQARWLHRECGIPVLIVRFFNAFGPRDYYDRATSHVAPALIRRVMEGEDPLTVWGTGFQTRALVDARDIARALVALAETPEAHDAQPVNIGHEQEIPLWDLAETIVRLCGKDVETVCDTSYPDGYPRRAADPLRLRALIGWVPDTPLEKTLADMIADYERQREAGYIND